MSTLEPVTTGGWYEHDDGTVGEYRWTDGCCQLLRTVASWSDVPSPASDGPLPPKTYERDPEAQS